MGLAAPLSLGGKPRSLDIEDGENFGDQKSRDAKSALKDVNTVDSASVRFICVKFKNIFPFFSV